MIPTLNLNTYRLTTIIIEVLDAFIRCSVLVEKAFFNQTPEVEYTSVRGLICTVHTISQRDRRKVRKTDELPVWIHNTVEAWNIEATSVSSDPEDNLRNSELHKLTLKEASDGTFSGGMRAAVHASTAETTEPFRNASAAQLSFNGAFGPAIVLFSHPPQMSYASITIVRMSYLSLGIETKATDRCD